MASSDENRKVLTVTQLTRQLQRSMRERFADVWVGGEVSNLSRPQSGHVYFSLADEEAQIRAVIWRRTAVELNFELADGLAVVCRGEIDIYPPRGVYQLLVSHVEPLGLGALQLAFRQLHSKLAAEGLFDAERKQPLPKYASRIAVVTSPTGAALRDFLQVALRRWDNLEILVIPCRVQGAEASPEIARAIQIANRLFPAPDVLVVTRGGGSMEDLWAFNDERVVRAIVSSELPTISAVGHEIDVTLSDLAADVRALTPSEAGELVVPPKSEAIKRLDQSHVRLRNGLRSSVETARQLLKAFAARRVMTRPQDLMQTPARCVDEFEIRLHNAGQRMLDRGRNRMANLSARLETISPLSVLGRGYSVTHTDAGELITDINTVNPGQRIVTRLAQGHIESTVDRVDDENDREVREKNPFRN